MHTKEMHIKVHKSKKFSPEHTHNQSSDEEQSMTSTRGVLSTQVGASRRLVSTYERMVS